MTHQLVSIGWMLLALVLSASIGLERQIRGKSAGIRTQAIVGLTACLMMLISKYGFSDILIDGITRYDPSRVASQIVSGIGFLGAGIILTRHGAIRGLTTAATIWETAAIGMACGAGLWWLAMAGTVLHFIVIALLTPLVQFILMRTHGHKVTLTVHYTPGHGVLSTLLTQVVALGWTVSGVSTHTDSRPRYHRPFHRCDAPGPLALAARDDPRRPRRRRRRRHHRRRRRVNDPDMIGRARGVCRGPSTCVISTRHERVPKGL